jgi:hypothetical protein
VFLDRDLQGLRKVIAEEVPNAVCSNNRILKGILVYLKEQMKKRPTHLKLLSLKLIPLPDGSLTLALDNFSSSLPVPCHFFSVRIAEALSSSDIILLSF